MMQEREEWLPDWKGEVMDNMKHCIGQFLMAKPASTNPLLLLIFYHQQIKKTTFLKYHSSTKSSPSLDSLLFLTHLGLNLSCGKTKNKNFCTITIFLYKGTSCKIWRKVQWILSELVAQLGSFSICFFLRIRGPNLLNAIQTHCL